MNAELHDLYQQAILDHNRRPRNFRVLDSARKAEGHNRLCGDRLTVYVRIEDDVITDVGFQGTGCAIMKASASLMTESVQGTSVAAVKALADRVEQMLVAPPYGPVDPLGPLTALAGVRQFPVRIRCAILPWRTLCAALDARVEAVSTE